MENHMSRRTAMYYVDPDGNQVELQIDNFDTSEECHTWFPRPEFAENPIEITFDPNDLAAKFHAGVPVAQLKHFGFPRMAPKSTMTERVDSR
jgi:polyisoprenoid-binding protein YceI